MPGHIQQGLSHPGSQAQLARRLRHFRFGIGEHSTPTGQPGCVVGEHLQQGAQLVLLGPGAPVQVPSGEYRMRLLRVEDPALVLPVERQVSVSIGCGGFARAAHPSGAKPGQHPA